MGSQRPQGESQCKDRKPPHPAGRSDPSSDHLGLSATSMLSEGTGGGDKPTPFSFLQG